MAGVCGRETMHREHEKRGDGHLSARFLFQKKSATKALGDKILTPPNGAERLGLLKTCTTKEGERAPAIALDAVPLQ